MTAKRPRVDIVAIGKLASRPAALMRLALRNPKPICDALGIQRSKTATKRGMWALIRKHLAEYEQSSTGSNDVVPFSEIEEAIPGPLSKEELANVLAGGTRTRRGR